MLGGEVSPVDWADGAYTAEGVTKEDEVPLSTRRWWLTIAGHGHMDKGEMHMW
jgi:hypothetical protein